jgi:hypothetical protein
MVEPLPTSGVVDDTLRAALPVPTAALKVRVVEGLRVLSLRHFPLATTDFPPIRRGRAHTVQVNLGYKLQPELPALPRGGRPEPHRGDGRHHRRSVLDYLRVSGASHARPDRRRARAEPAFPPAGARGARARCAGDRPLQPDDPVGARAGGSRGLPRRAGASRSRPRCPATPRNSSTASAATASSSAHRRPAPLNALGYGDGGRASC